MTTSSPRTASLALRGAINYFLKKPFCISFEVTHSCNARCKHCHLGGPVEEQRASPQKYGELCAQLKPLVAQVSGGEPLLRRDLEQIIQALRRPKKAPYMVVTTNGALLDKPRYTRLRQAGVDEFSLSLDYPDERHDEFRGIPGLFGRIENLVHSLPSGNRKAITLCCVIQSDNFRDLIRMAELAEKWEVKLNFSTYTKLRTHDKSYLLSAEELEEFKQIIRRLLDFKNKHGILYTSEYVFQRMIEFFKTGSIPNCRTGKKFFNVNPDGTLSPCGLIQTDYKSLQALNKNFSENNHCSYCYTSIRANSEKPLKYLIKDARKAV
ncbi:MAG: radical SAM protein [Candidatus Aminicenantes bacterium]